MKMTKKHKIILINCIAMALVSGAFVGAFLLFNNWRNENAKWFALKEQIVEENSLVKNVYRRDMGPACHIMIVLNSSANFDQIEAIYKSVLTHLCDEETRKELITYHNGHASGELAFLEIDFRDSEDKTLLYGFIASKKDGFEEWYVDDAIDPDSQHLKYNMSDYTTTNDD